MGLILCENCKKVNEAYRGRVAYVPLRHTNLTAVERYKKFYSTANISVEKLAKELRISPNYAYQIRAIYG